MAWIPGFRDQFCGQSNIGVLLLNLFVGSATAQEYSWRTLNLWLSRGVARDHLLAAKLAAFILPSIMIVLTALLSAAGISTLISLQIDGHIKLDQLDIWALSVDMLLTIYTMLPYAAFTFLLAIATRSAVIAIGGSLIYIMVLEALLIQALPLAGNSLSKVAHYLPAKLTESVLNLNQFGQGLADGTLPDLLQPVQAIACIGLWTLLFFSISLWIFRRQDFIG